MNRLLISFLILIIFSCTTKAQSYVIDTTLGYTNAQMVAQFMGIYDNEDATKYIRDVGERLVDRLGPQPFNYRFYIVDSYEPNAFALPGGFIFFTRGILAITNSEDELSGVMGHEIIHSANRHSIQQMKKSVLPSLLQIPGAIVGGVVNERLGNIINAPIVAGSELFLSSYSRRHESEADDLGIELSSLAGYDPASLADLLYSLNRQVEFLTGEEEKKSYFSSHPYTPKRIDFIRKRAKKLEWRKRDQIAPDHEAFLSNFDGMYFKHNPKQGIFHDSLFLHPDLNLAVTFPANWEKINIPIAVGAIDPGQEGLFYISVAEKNDDPEKLGKEFSKELASEYKITPESEESYSVNGIPTYKVVIHDNTGDKKVIVNSIWFRPDTLTFQAIGVSYEDKADTILMVEQSIRKITNKERNSIVSEKIRIVKANEGEKLSELIKRTDNVLEPEFIAIINGMETEEILRDGQLIKIVVEEKYVMPSD